MRTDEINDTIDKIILKNKISEIIRNNITIHNEDHNDLMEKCSVWNRKSVIRSFRTHASLYGLIMVDTDESGIAFELYDDKHDTKLKFTKKFIEQNLLDYKNQGKKEMNLEDLFTAYDNLPDGNKDAVNGIKFLYGNDEAKDEGVMGWSNFVDDDINFNQIGIPHYLFTSNEQESNLERVLAHESAHCFDYPQLTSEQKASVERYKNGTADFSDSIEVAILKTISQSKGPLKFNKTFGDYQDSVSENLKYLQDMGVSSSNSVYCNKSSDYGFTKVYEDYAEACSMIITGYKNPDNPNATVRYDDRLMQYREWITVHPYQAQYLIKELYGETVSIKELRKVGVSTPLVPKSQTINDILGGIL